MDHVVKLDVDQDQSRGQQNRGSQALSPLDNDAPHMREGNL